MSFIKDFFNRIALNSSKRLPEKEPNALPMPEISEIVERMYNQSLEYLDYTVEEVIYSSDKAMRYVILRNKSGTYTFRFEKISLYDEEEWKYFINENELPAMWLPVNSEMISFFDSKEDALAAIKCEPEYTAYFND